MEKYNVVTQDRFFIKFQIRYLVLCGGIVSEAALIVIEDVVEGGL